MEATKWSQIVDSEDNDPTHELTLTETSLPFASFDRCHSVARLPSTDRLMQFRKGTTTLAFEFQGGIMVAVDARVSQGSYISTQEVVKFSFITDNIIATIAGGGADCQFWNRVLARNCRMHRLRNGEPITVGHAANKLSNILRDYHFDSLNCGIIVAGWNPKQKTFGIYYVNESSVCLQGKIFSVGSGSRYAYGIIDANLRFDMTTAEAHLLAKKAIYHAAHRDGGSGGVVRVRHISEAGITVLTKGQDVDKLRFELESDR